MSGSDTPRAAASDGLRRVRNWVRLNGDLPTDDQLVEAVAVLLAEWRQWRGAGMDIVASGCRDELEEIIAAMADL